jgi:hypothetical protein
MFHPECRRNYRRPRIANLRARSPTPMKAALVIWPRTAPQGVVQKIKLCAACGVMPKSLSREIRSSGYSRRCFAASSRETNEG